MGSLSSAEGSAGKRQGTVQSTRVVHWAAPVSIIPTSKINLNAT